MGAGNVTAAFIRWAGKVPATSMQILVFMANVAKDKDEWPWYGQGQEAIAHMALGRPNPGPADVRAVSRAMAPLLAAGAVTVERAAANRGDGNTTARYRLNLTDAADKHRQAWQDTHDGKRRTSDRRRESETHDGKRRVPAAQDDPRHTTVSDGDIRRKVTRHTTVSDETYDGNRRTKEEEEEEELEDQGRKLALRTAVTAARAAAPEADSEPNGVVVDFASRAPRQPAKPSRAAQVQRDIAAASARRAAAREAHQARQEAT